MTESKVRIKLVGETVDEMLTSLPATALPAPAAEVTLREEFAARYKTRSELQHIPRAEPLIDGVLDRRAYHVLCGRGATYKSFVALDFALSIATGTAWNGRTVHRGRVLYIAGEGAEGLHDRTSAWEEDRGVTVPDDFFHVRDRALNMHTPGPAFNELLEHVREGGYSLVIIDTLRRVSGTADENGSHMGAVVDNIAAVQRATPDTAVLVIAHTTKKDDVLRGFSGLADDADVIWWTKLQKGGVRLENEKMKNGPKSNSISLVVEPVKDSVVLHEATIAGKLTQDEQWVLDQIIRDPGNVKGSYRRQNGNAAYTMIDRLRDRGMVVETGSGNKKQIYPANI